MFFLSGVAALTFETLWFRQASLTFGGSVWASALVLSSFMAGLALGNGLAARFGALIRRPIATYAVLELVIGVFGMGLVLGLPTATPLVAQALGPFLASEWGLQVARFAFAFLLLLGPAIAMGATLPVLVKAFGTNNEEFGRTLGLLYGINTLGAVVGALAAELHLIPRVGIVGSGCIAAGLNVVSAILALLVAPRVAQTADASAERSTGRITVLAGRLLIAAFLSGGALLALEVVWFRMLALVLPQTSSAFAWMLAVVLAGIGTGGFAGSLLLRLRNDMDGFVSIVALMAGGTALYTYAAFPSVVGDALGVPQDDPIAILRIAVPLMLPTAFLSGVLFTWTGKQLHSGLGSDVRAAGLITLANTTGSMLGPLIATFLLLPTIGIERSIWLVGASYGLVAASCLPRNSLRVLGIRPVLHVAALGVFVWILAVFPFGLMASLYQAYIDRTLGPRGEELVVMREGTNQTIGYTKATFLGEPYMHRLMTDGYSMSGTHIEARRYMASFAYIPYAFHAEPKNALLISYGVGTTAAAILEEPKIERLDVVDISREILEMAAIPQAANPLEDPRVDVHLEDGRYFLQTTDRSYDLITGEPPPPAAAGVVNLYTREYFELMKSRLAPGGIVSYWLPVAQLTPYEAKAITRSFCDALEDCSLWEGLNIDWILLGTRDAASVDEATITRQWRDPERAAGLRAIGLDEPEQLAALFLADSTFLRSWSRDVPPLVDDWPARAPRWRVGSWGDGVPQEYSDLTNEWNAQDRFDRSLFLREHWPTPFMDRSKRFFRYQRIAREYFFAPKRIRTSDLHRVLKESELETLPLWLMGSDATKQRIATAAAEGDHAESRRIIAYHRGAAFIAERDYESAFREFDACELKICAYHAVFALAMDGRLDEARTRASTLRGVHDDARFRDYWKFMKEHLGAKSLGSIGP